MKSETVNVGTHQSHSYARANDTANIIGALIGGFATGGAIAVLLWQLV